MNNKDKKSINSNIEEYSRYFSEDLVAIEEELSKSKEYSSIIDDEIERLKGTNALGSGMSKGTTRYIIDILEKAIALQTQRAGLRKDKFAIKKNIVELAQKFAEDEKNETSNETLSKKLDEYLSLYKKEEKNPTSPIPTLTDAELDKEIEETLNKEENNK